MEFINQTCIAIDYCHSDMVAAEFIPSDKEVSDILNSVQSQNPDYGIKRILASIKSQRPEWTISEKRLKKLLSTSRSSDHPTSVHGKLTSPFPLVTPKVIDRKTGKGLFATQDIKEGTLLFTEKPLVFFPGWDIVKTFDRAGSPTCGHCYKMLGPVGSPQAKLQKMCKECHVSFCSKLCYSSALDTHHLFACRKFNPHMDTLLDLMSQHDWNAGVGAAKIICHVLSMYAKSTAMGQEAEATFNSFCSISEKVRHEKANPVNIFSSDTTEQLWSDSFDILTKALRVALQRKELISIEEAVIKRLLSMEFWLQCIGLWNLNNQDGGLYSIQSCINHHCSPNVRIQHPNRSSNHVIEVIALRDVRAGEQLHESYVDPRWSKVQRQNQLRLNYMFECICKRCNQDSPMDESLLVKLLPTP
jgi:hypothetical protein